MIFKKILASNSTQRKHQREAELYRNLIRREAKLGGEIFGPVPEGCRREFFCLDEHTWIWHEEWVDKNGKRQIRTTRYDVRPNGILKAQDGKHYQQLSYEEAQRLLMAIRAYEQKVKNELYAAYL